MKKIFTALLVFFYSHSIGQTLSTDRVKKIKDATVRISIAGETVGSGFFANEQGDILTCFHVVSPTILQFSKTLVIQSVRVFAHMNNGDSIEVYIHDNILRFQKDYDSARIYDYCILVPVSTITFKPVYFKWGSFSDLNEGDQVYTCGHPIGIPQKFITKGNVSTKYKNKEQRRDEALIDMTLNRGNSGGPIIKLGRKPKNDIIVGIADFIITPAANLTQNDINVIKSRQGAMSVGQLDPFVVMAIMGDILRNISIGVSGCVSIDHYLKSSIYR